MNVVEEKKEAIGALCEKHHVNSLDVFGSVLTAKFNAQSDIDFLVTFGNVDLNHYADNFFELTQSLEKLLGRKVDLISEKKIANPYLVKSINRNRMKIYDRGNPRLAA